MCTLIAIKNQREDFPLVVAANRDEMLARPATAPRVVHPEAPRVIAGLDEQSGGTWMGANDAGLFAAITNQRQEDGQDPTLESRGAIVMDALRRTSVEGIEAMLSELDGRRFNGFNLLFGDPRELRIAYGRRDRATVVIERLGDGVHVVVNDRLGSERFPKVDRARALVEPHVAAPWDELRARLEDALGDHEVPPLDAVEAPPPGSIFTHEMVRAVQALCIHTPAYGTRSSQVLALSDGGVAQYLYGEGPACESTLVDVGDLLK